VKAETRKRILRKRDLLAHNKRVHNSSLISDRLNGLYEYKSAGTVLFYFDFRSEVMTVRMAELALNAGKRVVAPKVVSQTRTMRLFDVIDLSHQLAPGYMGIPEPVPERCEEVGPEVVDVVVLPGVGFDERGARLGYGGGYYDRLAENLRDDTILVALAFEVQLEEHIPIEPHDRLMHYIVTEKRVIGSPWT